MIAVRLLETGRGEKKNERLKWDTTEKRGRSRINSSTRVEAGDCCKIQELV
jgi:hypothetical protein